MASEKVKKFKNTMLHMTHPRPVHYIQPYQTVLLGHYYRADCRFNVLLWIE
jgi:hypothetical protein